MAAPSGWEFILAVIPRAAIGQMTPRQGLWDALLAVDPEIVGRSRELAAIRATIDRDPGAPATVVLYGDPGVGKSVLLQYGIAYARAQGMRVVGGTGYETEAHLSFAGLHQLFSPIVEYVDRVEPWHRTILRRVLQLEDGPVPDRLAISAATLAALVEVAADGPLLFAVDDSHWVDPPTREVVMFLLPRLQAWDIRALFARRELVPGEPTAPASTVFHVDPLTDAAAEELLGRHHPDLPVVLKRQVLRDAAGNPLALLELPSTFSGAQDVGLELLPAGAPLQTRLEKTFAARVLELSPGTRTALLLTALDGDRLERSGPVSGPTGLSQEQLAEVERLGLVTRGGASIGLRFRHPMVRSAVVHTAAPEDVRRAHATLAETYRAQPERSMWHLAACTVEPDEAVAAEIERGALAAATRGGTGLAVVALERAAALTPDPITAARRLHLSAEWATEAGQLPLAERLLVQAADRAEDPAQHLRIALTRARVMFRGEGDLIGSRRLLMQALRQLDERSPAELVDRLAQMAVYVVFQTAEEQDWRELKEILDRLGKRVSESVRLCFDSFGDLAAAGGGVRARLAAAFDTLNAQATPWSVTELCRIAMRVDSLHEYRWAIRRVVDRESQDGAVFNAVYGLLFEARDRYLSGEWELSEQAAHAGLELSTRHGLANSAYGAYVSLGLIAASRGDLESARSFSQLVEQWAAPRGNGYLLAGVDRIRTTAALSEGDYETAYARLTEHSPAGVIPPYASYSLWEVYDLVEAATRTGRVAEARKHVAEADRLQVAACGPRLALLTAGARALAAADGDAVALFRRALALPRIEAWPFDHARLRLAFGELHRRNHRPGDARPELRRAADTFARLGATAWLQRAEQELRASGVAVSTVRQPSRVVDPADVGLTAQQLEVAQLAAAGLSNKDIAERLFLSPRTVSAHLYRAFPKLGISSRSALRDALTAAGVA
jgi:DNA-binding CsgD family transcriptional regulator